MLAHIDAVEDAADAAMSAAGQPAYAMRERVRARRALALRVPRAIYDAVVCFTPCCCFFATRLFAALLLPAPPPLFAT